MEFALKVRIISQLMKSDSCPNIKFVQDFYKHELSSLLKLAGLEDEKENDFKFRLQWEIVKDWSEQSRYEFGKTGSEAQNLYSAIEKEVLPWLKSRY